ncbi:hypothetical protein MATL_G00004540 [Megalops atlanticus]|uniref:SH3-domain binding protein 1 n=1 Tax=Megalops atlanticus TaxID=7932 RepID=A0A9D3QJ18_MEGAT|nr:hypothetical protein MATL_G00004540 [Megalops atlanticus]
MLKQFGLLKQFGSVGKSQDATDLLSDDLVLVEQRVEPARRAAQIIHKRLAGCLQSQQGLEAEKRTKKLPLMLLSVSMAESLMDLDGASPIRKVLEMTCYMESFLAKTLADFEVKVEKEVLEPLNKLSEEELPEILKNKKQFAKLTAEWQTARSRAQGKQDTQSGEVEEAWRRLENFKDEYSADLYHFASKEDVYASYFIRLLEIQTEHHKTSLGFLERNIAELKETHNQEEPMLSSSSAKVYGTSLLSHLLDSGREIAAPIQECVQMLLDKGMKEEGLFRLAGAASVVKKLKNSLDCGNVDHSEFISDPHAVAGALKCYLRELPEPLMTFDLYHEWFKAAGEKELSDRLEQLKGVLGKLPPENYNNLRYLLQFLARLSEQQEVNRMSPSNIAIVLGPNLLWPRTEGDISVLDMASASSVQVVAVIEPLIRFASVLFPEEVDFQHRERPDSPDFITSVCQGFSFWTEDTPRISLSSSLSLTDGFPVDQAGSGPLITKSSSVSCLTSIGENPPSDSADQQSIQDQSSDAILTQTQEPSPAESTPFQPPISPMKNSEPHKEERRSLQQRPYLTWDNRQVNLTLSHPEILTAPLSQPASPRSKQFLDSLGKRARGKKVAIRAPKMPPPPPPNLTNEQLPSSAQ